MTDELSLPARLEVLAKRMDRSLNGKALGFIGLKHPEEVREAAARIVELEAELARKRKAKRIS